MAIASKAVPVPERVPVKRALLSVYDKSGLVEFAQALSERGVIVHQMLMIKAQVVSPDTAGAPATPACVVPGESVTPVPDPT